MRRRPRAPSRRPRARRAGCASSGLRKWYGDTRALDGLDLEARPGEILGIAGPNGAGKSTLIKVLAGETRADAGEIELDGASVGYARPTAIAWRSSTRSRSCSRT